MIKKCLSGNFTQDVLNGSRAYREIGRKLTNELVKMNDRTGSRSLVKKKQGQEVVTRTNRPRHEKTCHKEEENQIKRK